MSKEEKSQCNDCFDGDHCKGKVARCECCPEKKDELTYQNMDMKADTLIIKKDVWEETKERFSNSFGELNEEVDIDVLISFIRQNFIPRAKVVELAKNFDVVNDTMGNPVKNPLMRLEDFKRMLLNFLTPEK